MDLHAQIKAGTAPWQKPWKPSGLVVPERLNIKEAGSKEPGGGGGRGNKQVTQAQQLTAEIHNRSASSRRSKHRPTTIRTIWTVGICV